MSDEVIEYRVTGLGVEKHVVIYKNKRRRREPAYRRYRKSKYDEPLKNHPELIEVLKERVRERLVEMRVDPSNVDLDSMIDPELTYNENWEYIEKQLMLGVPEVDEDIRDRSRWIDLPEDTRRELIANMDFNDDDSIMKYLQHLEETVGDKKVFRKIKGAWLRRRHRVMEFKYYGTHPIWYQMY